MNRQDLQHELRLGKERVERNLRDFLALEDGIPEHLLAAMSHSLLGGGKRLRPLMLLWTHESFTTSSLGCNSATESEVMRAACGLECLHTYSLIHDDLPAMDDDSLRRGQPTCHVAFDEATAILAGDALQALGFNWLAKAGGQRAASLITVVSQAVGPSGMVGGQQLDLDNEGTDVTAQIVNEIHGLKTGALLASAMVGGGLLAGLKEQELGLLRQAGLELGLAFQGADDLLDLHGDQDAIGKTPGKDTSCGKATWIRVEGEEVARQRMLAHGAQGLEFLEEVLPPTEQGERLKTLGKFMYLREA